jgi:6-phosphogluconolactonase
MIRRLLTLGLVALPALSAQAGNDSDGKKAFVYVGTYTQGEGKGVYILQMDLATGSLMPAGVGSGVNNPSFVALHPSGRFLYAVGEVGEFGGKKSGGVGAFALDPKTGALKLLNQQASEGTGPCYLVVDKAGKNVLVANYGGGSVAVLPIQEDGKLAPASCAIQHKGSGANPKRQEGPHAHSINLDAANHFAFAADLGLDKVLIYKFDSAKGTLTPNDEPHAALAPGTGPRHFAFHPSGKYAYVNGEMTMTVTAFAYDAEKGTLKELQTLSTLPEGFKGEGLSTAETQVTPDGKYVYVSNRGHDTLAIYAVDQATGKLTAVGHEATRGKTPRNFGIDPTGTFILAANQGSDTIVVFRIDPKTGKLVATGSTASVPKPVCIKFLAVKE